MTVSDIWRAYRELQAENAELKLKSTEIAELRREIERLRALLSALELGGTTERER